MTTQDKLKKIISDEISAYLPKPGETIEKHQSIREILKKALHEIVDVCPGHEQLKSALDHFNAGLHNVSEVIHEHIKKDK